MVCPIRISLRTGAAADGSVAEPGAGSLGSDLRQPTPTIAVTKVASSRDTVLFMSPPLHGRAQAHRESRDEPMDPERHQVDAGDQHDSVDYACGATRYVLGQGRHEANEEGAVDRAR